MAFDRRRAADELLQGREFAHQLRLVLRRFSSDGAASASASQDLISGILNSFSKTLSMLNHRCDSDDINGSIVDSPDATKSQEESGETNSKTSDRRGCYKRRKSSHSWTRESCSLVDDGQAWRKYGQKVILNAKFPRNYYRCTHKYDQSCQATKLVQQVEEDPPKFRTTYYGHHSCTNFLKASEIVLGLGQGQGQGSSNFGGVLLRFDSPTTTQLPQLQQDHGLFIHPSFPDIDNANATTAIKKEKDGIAPIGTDDVCSPSDYITAEHSPDHLSDVMMGCVVDFEDDVLQFEF